MKEQPASNVTVEDILQGHSPEVRLMVEVLRELVRTTAPGAIESAHPVWHSIHYHDSRNGYFFGIFPEKEGANLVFEFGILLPDPQNVLQGSGKQVRSLRLRLDDKIPEAALRDLILAAIVLPGSRKEKLAMIRSGARPEGGAP